jgi:GH15 family glucan-1,4-alpha-glucosidase
MSSQIEGHAVVGDCRSVALVSLDGAVDFLCWPRFDSPSLFAAILDAERGGAWRIAASSCRRVERCYVDSTNVLQTRFLCADGEMTLTDLMPVASEEEKSRTLLPDHWLLRHVACTRGVVDVEITFDPRPRFGLDRAQFRDHGSLGIYVETSEGLAILRGDVPMRARENSGLFGVERLAAGDERSFSLVLTSEAPAILPTHGEQARIAIDRSVRWWRAWSARAKYDGPHREEVIRSALALKLLAYAPSGAIIAAPTTSLPERVGADLNWDYRFCWLRDAAFTARALTALGYVEEADAFVNWLVHTTALTRPRLHALYDVFGDAPKKERELGHLAGCLGSKPVRIGNGARDQLQLDVYGETIEAAAQLVRATGGFDRDTEKMLVGFGEHVCANWSKSDHGIWEKREPPRPHTHSRLLSWTACDRLLQLHALGIVRSAPKSKLGATCEAIRREIECGAWNATLCSYVGVVGSDELDAITLLFPWYGFERADSVRMRATWRAVQRGLGAGGGLLRRYVATPTEGAFGLCSFWAAEYLALGGGSLVEAESLFRRLLGYANDVGLFAEEIDPDTGAALGNFPQGFTHVGVLNAALTLEERRRGEEARQDPGGPWHADRPSYAHAPGLEARS